MSADNGIYILQTNLPPMKIGNFYINQYGKYEFRVAHCQVIDDIYYSDIYLPILFGDSPVFFDIEKANEYAKEMEKNICYLEYGTQTIYLDKYFPNIKPETARIALDCYIGAKHI
jgi:hypothetical protein